MPTARITQCGAIGVNKDLSQHELPPNAWTDARNIRFLDGLVSQFLGHSPVFGTPSVTPLHIMPVVSGSTRYWIYAGTGKIYAVTGTTHSNITRSSGGDYTGSANAWTSTSLSGIPILNPGNAVDPPQQWGLNPANPCTALSNWPASTYCSVIRAYRNHLVALNVTKGTTNYPYMVKWSHPAEPGTVPTTWDITDATKDAGEVDLAEGGDRIVDGLQLRDTFLIYKESSIWRMDYTGGPFVFRFSKVVGSSGALNRNCIVEFDGLHCVLTNNDVIVHDGNAPTSVLDKQTRRFLFNDMDGTNRTLAFVFLNKFFNEVWVCYPAIGSSVCDRAMVWNYRDRTVSFRDLPNIYHGADGPVEAAASDTWASDVDPWKADISSWGSSGLVPELARAVVASSAPALYLMDGSAAYAGETPEAYVERRGMNFDAPERIKLIKRVRPRITGNVGETVKVLIGSQADPYGDPTWTEMTHTIGSTVANDCLVAGRYISVRFESDTAYQWRLDSYDIDYEFAGAW